MKVSVRLLLSLIVISALWIASGCSAYTAKSNCEITEGEAEKLLGGKVKFVEKSSPVFNLSESEKKDPKIKACGYMLDDKSFLYFQSNEYENDSNAVKFYNESKDNLIKAEKSGGDYWEDEVAIVDGGYIIHSWQENNLHINVIGRVQKIAFTIRASGTKTSQISQVTVKGLAVRISYKYPTQ